MTCLTLAGLQTNRGLQGLEDTLTEQTERNRRLQIAPDESSDLNEKLGAELEVMKENSGEHEETLSKLKTQIKEMRESDARMQEFKAELEERQSEVQELRRGLTSKGSEVEIPIDLTISD